MSSYSDKELGMHRGITRRDFLNGVAIGLGGVVASPLFNQLSWADAPALAQNSPGYYPPKLDGMRGSHPGSFDVAHELRDGDFWAKAGEPIHTGENYDLVVVGGGLSGLAAAYFYRAYAGKSARILILENHDDFGGHAKRNEFHTGRMLLANGGTWAIESPFPYSDVAHGLMNELGVDPDKLEAKCNDEAVYQHLKSAYFFDKETFGTEQLVVGTPPHSDDEGGGDKESWSSFLARTPLTPAVQRSVLQVQEGKTDYFPGLTSDQKKDRLSHMSYNDYLLKVVKVDPGTTPLYQTRTHGLYGVGTDAVSALDCWGISLPGFKGLKLEPGGYPRMGFTARGFATPRKNPYFFHYPDGNASIARLLVRSLIPESTTGSTAEDIVTARVDYGKLDASNSSVKIRLNSTVVRAKHVGEPSSAKEVEVSYATEKRLYTVRAKAVVMACWNMMVPYLCPEIPAPQKDALQYGTKVPLVYTVVAVRNWQAWQKLGMARVSTPGMYHYGVNLDRVVDIGEYRSPHSPDQPILLRMTRTPCKPGLTEREQHIIGRMELYETPYSTFERSIRDQLLRVLGPGGFDPARDITAITVNRWPHGYAYEYNPLFDPEWKPGEAPCEIGRKRFGRIAIANSDAGAAAYTDIAIDQAHRAVQELVAN
jgi:spermidine dehydrogenase